MKNDSRKKLLSILAYKRKQQTPKNYKNIGDFHNGDYDCDFVSPYTKAANNVNSDIMILLQDWCSESALRQYNPDIAE